MLHDSRISSLSHPGLLTAMFGITGTAFSIAKRATNDGKVSIRLLAGAVVRWGRTGAPHMRHGTITTSSPHSSWQRDILRQHTDHRLYHSHLVTTSTHGST
jgi:hypothetical protein